MKAVSYFFAAAVLGLMIASPSFANPHGASGDGKAWGSHYSVRYHRMMSTPTYSTARTGVVYRPTYSAGNFVAAQPQRMTYSSAFQAPASSETKTDSKPQSEPAMPAASSCR